MRKSLNLLAGVFLFVLVFSFFGVRVDAEEYLSTLSISENDFEESVSDSSSVIRSICYPYVNFGNVNFSGQFDEDTLYKVVFNYSFSGYFDPEPNYTNIYYPHLFWGKYDLYQGFSLGFSDLLSGATGSQEFVVYGSELVNGYDLSLYSFVQNTQPFSTTFHVNASFDLVSAVPLSFSDTDQYVAGYNAGYSDGLSEGQSQGYSNGYSDGYSAGESSGYNSGFQAGVDSVDTQSYYDAGYSAGQASGYAEGYDSGYDTGYSDAMARIESWGADTSSYPKLVDTFDLTGYTGQITCARDASDHEFTMIVQSTRNRSILSDHVYRLNGILENFNASNSSATWDQYDIYVNIGSEEYKVFTRPVNYSIDEDHQIDVFIPGYLMSSSFSIKVVFRNCFPRDVNAQVGLISVLHDGFDGTLTDCGPINNSQNETAKQTDDLTNGYDSSAGESVSNTFSDNADSLESAEDSIFTSAKSSLDGYSFFDLNSVPAVVTGLSFVSATMSSIFGAMGGASGAGIVLSVLFSVMIVSIVIGLYRYFVSSGKSGSGKGGRK